MKGLRKKITFVVVVPCILGLLLSRMATMGYIYFTYPDLMNHYADKMISHQKTTLLGQSKILGKAIGFSYVQKILDLVNLGSDFIESDVFYGMIVNENLTYHKIYESYNESDRTGNDSVWYYHNHSSTSQLPPSVYKQLNNSAVYDTILRTASYYFSQKDKDIYKHSYIGFSSELFYGNPKSSIVIKPNCNTGQNDTKNNCTCSLGVTNQYYNPTCRPFYLDTKKSNDNQAIITAPYLFNDNTRGESACKGLWNYSTNTLILTYCIDFIISDSFDVDLIEMSDKQASYSFTLNKEENVLSYKALLQSDIIDKTIIDLEFTHDRDSSDVKKEIRDFKSKILPLMTNQISKFTYYTKYGDKMMIAVSPIIMMMSSGGSPAYVSSVAVVMKKKHIESKFETLKDSCNSSLKVQIIFQSILLFFIILFTVVLTDQLSVQVINPIDHLLTILKKLKEGDLAVDILAAYEESPPEIKSLYDVFDKLRVVLRFTQIEKEKITDASFVYSQALNLFKRFHNKRAMEICYRELGYICYKKKMWEESGRYLYKALIIAIQLEIYDEYEIARIKTDAATAFVKTGSKRDEGHRIFAEAVQTFKQGNCYTDIVVAMIEIAESLAETNELGMDVLNFIEENLEKADVSERELLRQKFYYVKAFYLKNNKKFRSAATVIKMILEDFQDYLPEIWIKSVDMLIEIMKEQKIDSRDVILMKSQRRHYKKDVVIILSDSLIPSNISWSLNGFLKSILEPFDKVAVLQYSHESQLVYNLSKIPPKLIQIDKQFHEKTEKRALFDSIYEGVKQFRLNQLINTEDRNEWIIVICDSLDKSSKIGHEELFSALDQCKAGIIIINCYFSDDIFLGAKFIGKTVNRFIIRSEEACKLTFKEIEAYLCPYREVFV